MKVLVTGGTGYIGSHTCVELLEAGHTVAIVDDLCNSQATVVDKIEKITGKRPAFHEADVADKEALRAVFAGFKPDAVIHFAGLKAVGESCRIPLKYYRNNLDSTLTLLEVMEEFGCKKIVFSSSATVYGPENPVPYVETMPAVRHLAALPPTYPVAFALAASATQASVREVLLAYAFGWAENMVQAALKSMQLGQSAGQRILARLADAIPPAADHAIGLMDSERQAFSPMLAILSAQHEVQYSRLFRS